MPTDKTLAELASDYGVTTTHMNRVLAYWGYEPGDWRQTRGEVDWEAYDTTAGESAGQQLPRIKEIRIPGEGDYPGEWLILNPAWQTMMQDKLEAEGCMHEFRAFERNGQSEVAYTVNGRVVWGFHPRPLLQAALLASECTPPMESLEV